MSTTHLQWIWLPAVVMLESASMAAFAIMMRRLAAGGARVGVKPMLVTTYAANALSVSVPLAGGMASTAAAALVAGCHPAMPESPPWP